LLLFKFNTNEYGLIIDEFQHVPDLLSYIQTMVDDKPKHGYFILTGSQNFLMNQAITQSLVGRVSIHILLPFSIDEVNDHKLISENVEDAMFSGFYPAIYVKKTPPAKLYWTLC
jgi:uncharacterized protein